MSYELSKHYYISIDAIGFIFLANIMRYYTIGGKNDIVSNWLNISFNSLWIV